MGMRSLSPDFQELPTGPVMLQWAEEVLDSPSTGDIPPQTWHKYLDATSHSEFLKSLPDREHRERWAQTAFRAILISNYGLQTMLDERVRRGPDRVFLQETTGPRPESWTYARTARRLRLMAAAFISAAPEEPRVAILAGNCADGACCDLACLLHGILVAPLNVHFEISTLVWIFNRLGINIVVTDTDERLRQLAAVRRKCARPFKVFLTGEPRPSIDPAALALDAALARLSPTEADRILAARPRRGLTEVATVMFTSGSTGTPKGVAFTEFNLLTKRFARAAALPDVGNDETLLCYLPLYHTFGRYLELLGMLYWGGTYVFAADDSEETLLAQLSRVRPTGLVSVPIRWSQIRDTALDRIQDGSGQSTVAESFRALVGDRLRWGVSAAGFLDPRVFHFFQRNGVALCSGFGMTEATGGITMTPPGEYVDNTVGIPLPGAKTRFKTSGEMEVAGPYVARYLPDLGPGHHWPAQDPAKDHWLTTGDIFRVHTSGYLEIVDRAKDIYKNSKGQTVTPRRVERKFDDVPGIKRAFLVGDGRDYVVLLIVPDPTDPLLSSSSEEDARGYFNRIIAAANSSLAPHERIVDFAILERNFQVERDELTPKGSFRRKVIEEHFAPVVAGLYQGARVELVVRGITVQIPRWFFRDSGVLETDIVAGDPGVRNRRTGQTLRIEPGSEAGWVAIGDLEYEISGRQIDLGMFTHQPRLWIGNPSLIAFCPCRAGWDLPMGSVSLRVRIPPRRADEWGPVTWPNPTLVRTPRLTKINRLCVIALFGPLTMALWALRYLAAHLRKQDDRIAGVIRSRLESLARHPEEDVRCMAYQVLLLSEPGLETTRAAPAFVQSGLTFLNEKSIEAIAGSTFGQHRLEALRRRLAGYRRHLTWPGGAATRRQFESIFSLLAQFVRHHREYFASVRAELTNWVLHRADPGLAESAASVLADLTVWFEGSLAAEAPGAHGGLSGKIVFGDSIAPAEARGLTRILADPVFLRESVMLAFDEESYDPREIAAEGLRVSRIPSQPLFQLYRLAIRLVSGKHFNLLLAVGEDLGTPVVQETIQWLIALSASNSGPQILPKLGACRPDLGALSVAYVTDPTAWDRIRDFSTAAALQMPFPSRNEWRKLFVRAMAVFFHLWRNSGFRIVPGAITPANVAMPDADFREGTCVLSLTGWGAYDGPLSLVEPLAQSFYRSAIEQYPQCQDSLDPAWIFDACIEGLGLDRATRFFAELREELSRQDMLCPGTGLSARLAEYLDGLGKEPYLPLALLGAVDRFTAWDAANPGATPSAREDAVNLAYRLYRLDRFPESLRYQLYRRTYFARADSKVQTAFDRLLRRLGHPITGAVSHLEELSDLQAELSDAADREAFSRMVFPQAQASQQVEILAIGGDRKQVIVRSNIRDRHGGSYLARDPTSPSELGYLYRLFLDAGFPSSVYEGGKYLVAVDEQERVIGGACYRPQNQDVVRLAGVVVTRSLQGRGISGAILEDLCVRLAGEGFKILKTNYFLMRFYSQHGFRVDPRWGGLVRSLRGGESED
ncbi:MAG TPA: GNAT family N-acetyltransferase [Candidatus Methylomirabilis sp.]|nr:GNAT family N-acetyltransferase [Candidatus Methylomirabilis sp.]